MSDGSAYQLQQFIPFSRDVYFRLLERIGESFWPLHVLTLLLGVLVLLLALRHKVRAGSILLAPLWAWVGYAFFIRHYAELNWAGNYIGYAFIAEAVMLLLIALSGKGLAKTAPDNRPAVIVGLILALTGLVGWPFIGLLSGDSWYQAEVFGIFADPTAIATLGLLLIMLRGWLLWLSAIIPLLWLVISSLTWWVLLNS
ncbi:hypothetical protein SAMN06297280_2481 [Arsukibacterium tuosuense]|uniref:MFS transporter permease n=1 Tax=Arsukibacterium tuosuense TaxID=1323745 RepID=A0A285J1X1_9GAMM|nr:DUF6064 family protein [Arsukibacterium tuosuense]SNY53877.1 hypothetical protein SAMN06297280_2481 [Arsukibacterium tuosuense]